MSSDSVVCESACRTNEFLCKLSGTDGIYTDEAASIFRRSVHTCDYQDLIMNPLNSLCWLVEKGTHEDDMEGQIASATNCIELELSRWLSEIITSLRIYRHHTSRELLSRVWKLASHVCGIIFLRGDKSEVDEVVDNNCIERYSLSKSRYD